MQLQQNFLSFSQFFLTVPCKNTEPRLWMDRSCLQLNEMKHVGPRWKNEPPRRKVKGEKRRGGLNLVSIPGHKMVKSAYI